MKEDELQNIWQQANKAEIVKIESSKLLQDLTASIQAFDKQIKNRDNREIVVAILLIPFFLGGLFIFKEFISRLGLSFGILSLVFIIYKLKEVKKCKVQDFTASTKAYLEIQKRYLMAEQKLLNNILFWYIIPIAVSTILFISGGKFETYITWVLLVFFVILVSALVYYLNKRSVKKYFDPLIEEIENALQNFEN
jgi:hypothetical protein